MKTVLRKKADKSTVDPSRKIGELNVKQAKKRLSKAKESSLKMRKHLWPMIKESDLWLREDLTKKGYTTMPRTMPLLIKLISDTSKNVTESKSVPAGKAYLVLWCRVFDEGYLKIDSEAVAAMEAWWFAADVAADTSEAS